MSRSTLPTGIAAIAAMTMITTRTLAVDKTWANNGNVQWPNASNWIPNGVPTTSDTAIFNMGVVTPPYNVLFLTGAFQPINAVIDRLRIDSSPITFTPPQSTLTIDSTNITETARGLVIGRTPPGGVGTPTAVLNTLLGDLSTVYATLGADVGSSGTLNVNSAVFRVTGTGAVSDLIIGRNGAGAINMSGGSATIVAGDTILAKNAGATGSVGISGAGSNWVSSGAFSIGDFGNATLNITASGTLVSASGTIADSPGSVSSALVDDPASAWTISNSLIVGNFGAGDLGIDSGGRVQNTAGYVAAQTGSTGDVVAFGPNSLWTNNGILSVGTLGMGTLLVAAGADVVNTQGIIGHLAGSDGEVDVVGNGSRWHNTSHLYVGHDGHGVLDVTSAAVVDNIDASIGLNPGAAGEVTVAGGLAEWNIAGNLFVGAAGEGALTILADGKVTTTSSDAYIGQQPGSSGAVTVTGSGAQWTAAGVFVGYAGTGSLTASANSAVDILGIFRVGDITTGTMLIDGASLNTVSAVVGASPGSQGTAMLQNLALWDHFSFSPADPFIIGDAGTGTLSVLSDSDVLLFNQTLLIVGNGEAGHGSVTIDGQGSEVFVEMRPVTVGRMGTGVLDITAGGLLQSAQSVVYLGELPDSDGTVHIAGSNSMLRGSLVLVGNAGAGALDISAGGRLEASEVSFASFADSSGTATVNGSNSRLSALTGDGLLIVGSANTGSMVVSNGGVAEALEVFLGDGSTATGAVTVSGATSQLIAQEEINVGYFGTGTLTLTSGGKATAPIININSLGQVQGNGTLQGDVDNLGQIAPGLSAGTLSINGDYTQASLPAPPGTLAIELASPTSVDRLLVSGNATLGGTLSVNLIDGFTPSAGQTFTILNAAQRIGTFAQVNLPNGLDVVYTPTSVVLNVTATPCLADIAPLGGGDGMVNIDDLLTVISAWGSCPLPCPPSCPADIAPPAGNCAVNIDDLLTVISAWGPCL